MGARKVYYRRPGSDRVSFYRTRRLKNKGFGVFAAASAQTSLVQDSRIRTTGNDPVLLQPGIPVTITVDATFSNFSSGATGECSVGVYDTYAGVFIDAARLEGYDPGHAGTPVTQISFNIIPDRELSLVLYAESAVGSFTADAGVTMTVEAQ